MTKNVEHIFIVNLCFIFWELTVHFINLFTDQVALFDFFSGVKLVEFFFSHSVGYLFTLSAAFFDVQKLLDFCTLLLLVLLPEKPIS